MEHSAPVDKSRFALRRGRAALSLLLNPTTLVAAFWGIAAFVSILVVFGANPQTLPTPDECVDRLSASLIAKHGRPFLHLPYADVENVLHPRLWVTLGDHAVPAYAPVALYLYAFLTVLPVVGLFVVVALPASGVGAFAAGTARLLPKGRKWLALLAPALGFPALYWILRPWLNMSLLLASLAWALFFFASWRETGKEGFLRAGMAFVSLAAAIRPDTAAYVFPAVLCFTVASSPSDWKRLVVLVFLAGVAAVAVNLLLNWVITGRPLKAAGQILMDQASDSDDDEGSIAPGPIGTLLLPMGFPTLAHAIKFVTKYWIDLGALRLLLLGQLAIVPLLWKKTWKERVPFVLGVLIVVAFLVSRMSIDVFGAKSSIGRVHHSIPRYWTPVYLFAALPPLLYLGRTREPLILFVGSLLAVLVCARGLWEMGVHEGASLKALKRIQERDALWIEAIAHEVRADSIVFTKTRDKMLWSRFQLAMLTDMELAAASMERAANAHLEVFMVEPRFSSFDYRKLAKALKLRNMTFTKIDSVRGVYRMKAVPVVVEAESAEN